MFWIKAFIAGFIATLVFHQGVFALFHAAGLLPNPAYNLSPVPPLGIPSVLSLAFWGGVWGLAIAWLIRSSQGLAYWLRGINYGAAGPTLVALFVVFPLKGLPMAGGWDPKIIIGALILNGAWGFGVALFMRLMTRG